MPDDCNFRLRRLYRGFSRLSDLGNQHRSPAAAQPLLGIETMQSNLHHEKITRTPRDARRQEDQKRTQTAREVARQRRKQRAADRAAKLELVK